MNMIASAVNAKMFHSRRVDEAYDYLLKKLDTTGDRKYDPNASDPKCRDKKDNIKIFGWSWGGISAVQLARKINESDRFKEKEVAFVGTIDPVPFGRWINSGVVPSNVKSFWNRYQTHGPSVVTGIGFWGMSLPGGGANQIDLNPDGKRRMTRYPEIKIDHVTIVFEVSNEITTLLR